MGRTEGATKVLIHRAIKQLEQDLKLEGGGGVVTPEARVCDRAPDEWPGPEIMRLLELALKPVDPPASFVGQLEARLENVEAAALEALEELSEWELDAMRDPRNWVRPVAAVAVGTAAGAALVVLGLRSRAPPAEWSAQHRRAERKGARAARSPRRAA